MNTAMIKMMQICDSLFPIGAYTLSNGLETFVCQNRLTTVQDLEEYVAGFVQLLPYNDLGVMVLAYRHAKDMSFIEKLDELSLLYKTPMEVRNGSRRLCSRFLKLWEYIHAYQSLDTLKQLTEDVPPVGQAYNRVDGHHCRGNYAVAVGLYAREIGLPLEDAAAIYAYSLLTAIVTNAVKMVPLSQKDGQRILFDVQEKLPKVCEEAMQVSIDDLGIGGAEFDIAAMQHETLYSRLYMS